MVLNFCHPASFPESADPQNSERFENVVIFHEQIECHHVDTTFFDDIKQNNLFIIQDYSPEYSGYQCHMFKGTVLKERDGYSWWHNIHT